MALYNGERFVGEQLESFARQTRLPDELVVSDDCSTDDSVRIVRKFAASAPFSVTLLQNEENAGVNKNFERAISSCTGDLIFYSDFDDVWYPEKVATIEKAFEACPSAGLAMSDADLVDEELRPLGRSLWQARGFNPSERTRKRLARRGEFERAPWHGTCLAFRGEFKSLLMPFPGDGEFRRWSIADVLIAHIILCSGAGGLVLVPKPLLAYRQHTAQMAGAAADRTVVKRLRMDWPTRQRQSFVSMFAVLEKKLSEMPVSTDRRCEALRQATIRHCQARCHLPAKRATRIWVVGCELLSLRYSRFSSGILSAAKDLFFVS